MIDNPLYIPILDNSTFVNHQYIKDTSKSGIVYYGRSANGLSTSSVGWTILRSITTGGLTTNELASGSLVGYKWDDRANYFSSASAFSNLVSTRFDGINDYVSIADVDVISTLKGTNFTVSLWFNPDNSIAAFGAMFTVTSTSSVTPLLIQVECNNSSVYFARRDDAETSANIQPTAFLTPGTYNHIVITKIGDTYTLFLNRVAVTPVTKAFTTFTVNAVTFGATRRTTTTEYYSGLIDEATVWNVGMTPAEVVELYNSGVPLNPTQHSKAAALIAHWQFGDIGDTFPIINDRKGANHGTMTNMLSSSFVNSPARV